MNVFHALGVGPIVTQQCHTLGPVQSEGPGVWDILLMFHRLWSFLLVISQEWVGVRGLEERGWSTLLADTILSLL